VARTGWRRGLAGLVAGGLALAAGDTRALSIGLVPATAVPTAGSISLDLVVSGLVGGAAPSLGGFQVDLGWDPARLALAQVDFGSGLGDPAALEAVADSLTSPGFANLAEVSLLPPAALDTLQSDAFVLTSLRFTVVSPGAAAIDVLRAEVADAPSAGRSPSRRRAAPRSARCPSPARRRSSRWARRSPRGGPGEDGRRAASRR
jgi:hypothetical protein